MTPPPEAADARTIPPDPDGPAPEQRFRRRAPLRDAPGEIWQARLLVRTLAERELRAFYKQAALGVAWAILAPITLMIVFTVFIQRVASVDTSGVPYSLFTYIGLVPWNFFSQSVTTGGMSLVTQMTLVNKLKCPREVFPLSSIAVAGFNSFIAGLVLLVLFAVNGVAPKITAPLALIPLAVQVLFTIAVTLIVSATTVYMRDLRHALPLLLQLGLFATPIVYGLDAIPANWRPWYSLANPLAPIIDSYRQTVLYGNAPDWGLLGMGTLTTMVLLLAGLRLFRRLETGFADVA